MTAPILHLEGITKKFASSSAPAVNGCSLALQPGQLLGLLGASGCGKTTLLRLIAGFERPDAGKIEIGGRVAASPQCWVPPEQRLLGMVFQDYALFPHLQVFENVAFGLRGLSKAEISQRVKDAIALVRLEGLENRYPYELSGGQQQRVALARALAPQPSLVLLDEPLSNLDQQVRLQLREEVREILKASGTAAIFVTHDQEEALAISDCVAVMYRGKLEQIGTPEEIYLHPASRYVAEFVTQANFLPATRIEPQLWQTEVGCFAIELPETAADTGELMIRQEDLILQPEAGAPVEIRDRQFLGREYRYCLQTPSGKELHARAATSTLLPVGARVQLSVANAAARVFAADGVAK